MNSMQSPAARTRAKKPRIESTKSGAAAASAEDDWDGELGDSAEPGVEWLEMTPRASAASAK